MEQCVGLLCVVLVPPFNISLANGRTSMWQFILCGLIACLVVLSLVVLLSWCWLVYLRPS